MKATMPQRATAEFLGTAFLVAAVVGSGIMAERLSGGNAALALLGNTIATSAALFCLIQIFLYISGSHFNPVVTALDAVRGGMSAPQAAIYTVAQVGGGIAGTGCANLMFELPMYSPSHHVRNGPAQWLSEGIATFGLIIVIRTCARVAPQRLPAAVAAYIAAAYWFTASTSFANPAVTIARCLSNTFAGIRPADVPAFIAAEFAGAALGFVISGWLIDQMPIAPLEP